MSSGNTPGTRILAHLIHLFAQLLFSAFSNETGKLLHPSSMAGSSFNPTLAHQERHLDHYFERARACFDQINQQLKSAQFYDQEAFETKHTGFARLVN